MRIPIQGLLVDGEAQMYYYHEKDVSLQCYKSAKNTYACYQCHKYYGDTCFSPYPAAEIDQSYAGL